MLTTVEALYDIACDHHHIVKGTIGGERIE